MTKVFISYSYADKEFVEKLSNKLEDDGISIFNFQKISVGENFLRIIKEAIEESDYILIVLSKRSVNSTHMSMEISSIMLREVSEQKGILVPILLEDCDIPFSLRNRLYSDFRLSFDKGYESLLNTISNKQTKKNIKFYGGGHGTDVTINSYEYQIKKIAEEYNRGNLTLFCGAGISYEAGIPTWNTLLKALLKEVYSGKTDVPDIDDKLATLFQKRINISPLIFAKYLKNLLGNSCLPTLRDTLYKDCTYKSKTIDAIAELSRPKRGKSSLRSIITFNFDDLIENALSKDKTDFKCIYNEGERHSHKQIPIYHPHGCLPSDKRITSKNEVVFSEDAYHSQFIDSFSWSNLIQLNHLNSCTCLFLGISLTDPNMRRLLDVSIRKNGKGEKNHYIIKKRYHIDDLYPENDIGKIKDERIIPVIETIEEQDANSLGFNVIWVNNYNEIPNILLKINSWEM